ncbi:MAG: hypothetical protein JSR46_06085, partial [Verrucomicrobia bacterium]|nr:hypothetical protein [Verrucomicrobiota bacterium]
LATFLVKLPARAVRNIVKVLYDIVKTCIYAAVHPLKALNQLAKLLVNLAYELTKPETWTKIGAGMIGASCGQALITGSPLSAIGVGIGAAMVIGGLSVGALQAALEAEEGSRGEAALQNLDQQIQEIPETMLTGFLLGLLMGGIRRFAEPVATAVTVEVPQHQPVFPPIEPPVIELPITIPAPVPVHPIPIAM